MRDPPLCGKGCIRAVGTPPIGWPNPLLWPRPRRVFAVAAVVVDDDAVVVAAAASQRWGKGRR